MLETNLQYTVMARARRVLGRMKVLILCVMIYGLSAENTEEVLSLGRWKEQVIAPEFLLNSREDISESSRDAFLFEDNFRPKGLNEIKRITNTENVGIRLQPRLVTRSLQCTCETQYEIRDLGDGHYPRYLTTSSCVPKACLSKFNSCRLLHYIVYVLSQRELSELNDDRYSHDSDLQETPLPEALRHKWQLKPMKIPVACVSMTG
ncbi:PTTH protein, partial [Acromyrmex heyeri]